VRIGYDRKSAWLLTHRVPHRKQEGIRHEAEYTLDLVRVLGIEPSSARPFVPIRPDAQNRIERLLQDQGLGQDEAIVAIHPSASSRSKRWMPQRFAQVADRLIEERQVHVVLVAGSEQAEHVEAVERAMHQRPINFAGQLSVGELACLFRRCRVLISNDSGPVHIAAAVGTPVVDLFGRSQPGLNPARWRALGPDHVVLIKEVDSQTPLPRHGEYESPALAALSVEEVYRAILPFLDRRRVQALTDDPRPR
jgi:ADP-heptose:LPS heptosyltransferase